MANVDKFSNSFTVAFTNELTAGIKLYHLSLNLFQLYVTKFECSAVPFYCKVIQLKSATKLLRLRKHL